jgi:hypothetical protein
VLLARSADWLVSVFIPPSAAELLAAVGAAVYVWLIVVVVAATRC